VVAAVGFFMLGLTVYIGATVALIWNVYEAEIVIFH